MTGIAFSSAFKRAFKKRIEGRKDLEERSWRRVEMFTHDPHNPQLRTHKLSGELRELWSFAIEYDCRVVFYFASANRAVFVDVGTHDEVY